MKKISPTFETVFTEAYWGEVEDLPAKTNNGGLILADIDKQMDTLTSHAAEAVFRGDPRQWLPIGTQIGIPGESHYTQPGNILLVDVESLVPDKQRLSDRHIRRDSKNPFAYQSFIHNEGDLMALPSTLFMRNSLRLRDGEVIQVVPYAKSIPRIEDGKRYGKRVLFLAYGLDRKNKPALRTAADWNVLPEGTIEGAGPISLAISRIPALTIGESFHVGKDIVRARSAELCVSGLLEPVKVKQKSRKGLVVGRLATSHTIA